MSAREIAEDRQAWLNARRFRPGVGYCIGSSDVPSILGLKGAGTPVRVWHDKVHDIQQPENAAMLWGKLHEETIARYWRDRNRAAVFAVGLIARDVEPWQQTTLDRRVSSCPLREGDERCALEIKTSDAFASRRWHALIPDVHLAQMIHQIHVTGYTHVHYALLKGGNDYVQGVVRAEEEREVLAYVIDRVRRWRSEHLAGAGREVQPDWPIEDRAASLIELDGLLHPERSETRSIADVGDVQEFARLRAQANALKREVDKAKARLLQAAEGARWVTTDGPDGPHLVYEFAPRDRTKVELSVLRERYPAAYADPDVVSHRTSWQINIAKDLQVTEHEEPEESQ